jgi:hypothetical protein
MNRLTFQNKCAVQKTVSVKIATHQENAFLAILQINTDFLMEFLGNVNAIHYMRKNQVHQYAVKSHQNVRPVMQINA